MGIPRKLTSIHHATSPTDTPLAAHTCNFSTRELEAIGLGVQNKPQVHGERQDNLDSLDPVSNQHTDA